MKPGREWPGVGTGAVVVKDEALLMVHRAGAHGAGTWSVPGGWVEFGEHPVTGAIREVLEETGITVAFPKPLDWTSVVHPGDPPDFPEEVHAITLWVSCRWVSGQPRVTEPEKCPEVRWVPFDEVLDLPLFDPLADWWPMNVDHFRSQGRIIGAKT